MFPRLSQYSSLCSVYLGLQCVNNVTIQHYMNSLHTTLPPRPFPCVFASRSTNGGDGPKNAGMLRDPV